VGEEGSAPRRLGVARRGTDHLGGQATHRPAAGVDESRLPREGRAVLDDADDVARAAAQAAGREDEHVALVAVDLGDVAAQASRGVGRVELGLDDDLAADDVQATGEAEHRRDLGLATAGFGHLEA
jgi:hypothetical protein